MRFTDIIDKKARGEILTQEEIQRTVMGFVSGEIPDYQMSAMLMAIRCNGMTPEETSQLTLAMMNSGDIADLSDLPGIKLDKHSTGGVGDTTTLVVAPLVAACGGTIAKMSGRGLGHAGGTVDKLESIPGLKTEQSTEAFKQIVQKNGVAVIGQSGNFAPADKKIYALRDVTGTVESIPLIASSIMSKKLACGTDAIMLDVKAGKGAFMKTPADAETLAITMVDIGKLLGRNVMAVITDMNRPLGNAIGNALEFREAVQLLSGAIPPGDPLYEVCMLLGQKLLIMGQLAKDDLQARIMLENAIANGEGLCRLQKMVQLMGGDASYVNIDKIDQLCNTKHIYDLVADRDGMITELNAYDISLATVLLGAGRETKTDTIDPAVGLVMKVRCGDLVRKGDALCTLYVNDETHREEAERMILSSIIIGEATTETFPLFYGIVE